MSFKTIGQLIQAAPYLTSIIWRIKLGQQFGFSFNLSDRCPVGCDCYWRAQDRVQELSDEAVIEFFRDQKQAGKVVAVLVGGEPYVRRDLIPRLVPTMPYIWIITSGTTPLLNLEKTTHFISVDGADAQTHDQVRKMPGLFNRIVKNLRQARSAGPFPAFIHTVLNKLNFWQIEDIVNFWRESSLVDGILFSTLTPIDKNDNHLRLDEKTREDIVVEILRQKSRTKGFICMTDGMINDLHPNRTKLLSELNCGTAQLTPSFDAAGKPMPKCILSDKANCQECGCVVTPWIAALKQVPWKSDVIFTSMPFLIG